MTSVACADDGTLDDNTEDDDRGSNEHANPSAKGIDSRANEWKSCNTTDLGHRADNTSLNAHIADIEEGLEMLLGEKVTEEGRVETVGGRAAEPNNRDQVKLNSDPVAGLRGLLEHGLVESLISDEDFGGHDLVLVERVVVVVMFGDMRVDVLLRNVCHRVQMRGGFADMSKGAQVCLE